jgi:hypothetical protein
MCDTGIRCVSCAADKYAAPAAALAAVTAVAGLSAGTALAGTVNTALAIAGGVTATAVLGAGLLVLRCLRADRALIRYHRPGGPQLSRAAALAAARRAALAGPPARLALPAAPARVPAQAHAHPHSQDHAHALARPAVRLRAGRGSVRRVVSPVSGLSGAADKVLTAAPDSSDNRS